MESKAGMAEVKTAAIELGVEHRRKQGTREAEETTTGPQEATSSFGRRLCSS